MREERRKKEAHIGSRLCPGRSRLCPGTMARERSVPAISGTFSWGSVVLAILGNHSEAPQVGPNRQKLALMVLILRPGLRP